MTEPIEESYFNWLCAKVLMDNREIYRDLLRILHTNEFIWILSGDVNRADDGIELRTDFLRESRLSPDFEWEQVGCSIFEMLLAFSQRASFQTDDPVRDWFWEIITNLGLREFRRVSRSDHILIQNTVETLIWRTYEPSGHGGMFPLRFTTQDQRQVEIWYQFCEYVEENGRI